MDDTFSDLNALIGGNSMIARYSDIMADLIFGRAAELSMSSNFVTHEQACNISRRLMVLYLTSTRTCTETYVPRLLGIRRDLSEISEADYNEMNLLERIKDVKFLAKFYPEWENVMDNVKLKLFRADTIFRDYMEAHYWD